MKAFRKIIFSLLLVLSLCLFVACGDKENQKDPDTTDPDTIVDYVSKVKLDKSFENKVFVNDGIEEMNIAQIQPVDGDTIHVTDKKGTLLKLRFLGVDTPESTAQVEPWGSEASKFTKNAVKNSVSVVITADNGVVERDSYERYLAWIWYKPTADADYKLLNLELAQLGYSKAAYSGVKQYKEELSGAITQARRQQIKVWGETDPDYCYTEAIEVSLPALKKDINENAKDSQYFNKKVIFEAVVARKTGQTYYLIDTDIESGITYGIQVFHRTSTGILDVLGTRVKISGTITYYDTAGVFQLTDVIDRRMSSNKNNLKVVEENVEVIPQEVSITDITESNPALEFTLVRLQNLKVNRTYTTNTDGSSSNGAISIYCTIGEQKITVRTVVLIDRTGKYIVDKNNIVLESNFSDKTIDVVGIIEKYEGNYQIKLVSMDDVTIR
ncbi:MAG: thermonuclease family protein [Anaeroplasmataceae bacterium]|nr:thermonuclease family protein [Anaeroplasmataceae bacterium]